MAADGTFRTLRAIRLAAPVTTPLAVAVADQLQRTISNTRNTQALPGMVVRSEGASATGDPAVDEAYDGLGNTYEFYREMLDRNSIDDQGLPCLKPNSGFRRFARLTAVNAWNLFPDGEEHRIVQDAWRQVGALI